MRTAIVVAVVALITAGTTSAAYQLVITSKQIKNGTIQPVDLSATTKRTMRGAQGLAGPAGPQGPRGFTGERGERGPAGFNSVISWSGNYASMSPNQGGTSTATCTSGYKAVGGGFRASSSVVSVYVSQPISGGWEAKGFNYGEIFTESLQAYVLCASS
jgi:hypothetical protein